MGLGIESLGDVVHDGTCRGARLAPKLEVVSPFAGAACLIDATAKLPGKLPCLDVLKANDHGRLLARIFHYREEAKALDFQKEL